MSVSAYKVFLLFASAFQGVTSMVLARGLQESAASSRKPPQADFLAAAAHGIEALVPSKGCNTGKQLAQPNL
jgi:hypothetical protein